MNDNDTHTRLPDHTVCIADELKRAHPDWIAPQTWERCGCPTCEENLRLGREMFAPADADERVGAACVSCGYVFTAADVDEDPGSIHRHADGYICDACDEGQRTDHLERAENARIGYYDRHGN